MPGKKFPRILVYAPATALLLIIAALVILRDRTPFGRKNSVFAAEPGSRITSVVIAEEGRELRLSEVNGKWLTGNGKEARKNGIAFLNAVITGMKIKSPVSEDLFNREIISKGIRGAKVRVYDNRKLLASFIVYRTTSNIYGNIMKKGEKSKPFILYLPGYEGDIGSTFTADGLFWEPWVIFNLLPSEIESVTLTWPSDTASSFTVRKKGLFAGDRLTEGFDSLLAARYISYFTFIPFEEWVASTGPGIETGIISGPPLCLVDVKIREGNSMTLTLWEKKVTVNDTVKTDPDRLYGRLAGRDDLFVVRYFDVDPILKKRRYFIRR